MSVDSLLGWPQHSQPYDIAFQLNKFILQRCFDASCIILPIPLTNYTKIPKYVDSFRATPSQLSILQVENEYMMALLHRSNDKWAKYFSFFSLLLSSPSKAFCFFFILSVIHAESQPPLSTSVIGLHNSKPACGLDLGNLVTHTQRKARGKWEFLPKESLRVLTLKKKNVQELLRGEYLSSEQIRKLLIILIVWLG